MEGLEVLVERQETDFQNTEPDLDIDYLKNLKETSQVFINKNNFNETDPDFKEMTEDQFIEYIGSNSNKEILEKFDELNVTEDFRSSMSQIYHSNKEKSKIFIFFVPTSSQKSNVGIDTIKTFCRLVILLNCNEGVMISEKPLTSKSRELLESSNVKSFTRENIYNIISYVDDMFINVVDHCLSPKVLKIYSGKELESFLEEEQLNPKDLPRMMVSDPIAKFYRARVGDVIMMQRKTGNKDTLINEQIIFYAIAKKK